MKIDFYFDPSCPWCWITSRWLLDVAKDRHLTISWKPFSLALKNDELNKGGQDATPHGEGHRAAHRVLRVIEAAVETGGERGKLYSDIGKMKHVDGYDYTDMELSLMLSLSKLPESLISAADNTSYDDTLKQFLNEAIEIVGEDVGVPIIIFEREDHTKLGYFGPVLMKQPDHEEALKLWDGLSTLAVASEFYELKRSRPANQSPDTGTHPTTPLVC